MRFGLYYDVKVIVNAVFFFSGFPEYIGIVYRPSHLCIPIFLMRAPPEVKTSQDTIIHIIEELRNYSP